MKRLFISIFICILGINSIFAQHNLLWKISGNHLQNPSYLFGTLHMEGGIRVLDSIEGFESAFNSVKQYACETLTYFQANNYNQPNKSISNEKFKPWPSDSTYDNLLTRKEKRMLDSVIVKYNLSNYWKLNFRPIALLCCIQFSVADENRKKDTLIVTTSDETKIIDLFLEVKARKRALKLVSLETFERNRILNDSLNTFYPQTNYKQEVKILTNYILTHGMQDSVTRISKSNVLNLYLKQDMDASIAATRINLNLDDYSEFIHQYQSIIVDKRNNEWMQKIPTLISDTPAFISVGTAHLAGENGLIKQLLKMGYIVEPVN